LETKHARRRTGYVLAKRYTPLNADEALLTGLLHAVGKLYI